ncbi:MAG: hypothetical protein EOP13_00475 [Pseudomonas sp.]|uniref:hypothetical protein n=1 Tax=Pseudomonas sp. TaxID=306 RepID=UPI00120BB454|nr:hypothetical protein [Pseudomonas sp.]RZI76992.1 MAG: hypothetical protein EOP13_00475 [Pseudomonas sp.]
MSETPSLEGDDDDAALAEGAITLWSNLLAMIGMQLRDSGTSREEVLEMLTMLHETNEETIRSPRARQTASRHLMAVYRVLAES